MMHYFLYCMFTELALTGYIQGCLSFDSTALLALSIAAGVVGIVFGLLEVRHYNVIITFVSACFDNPMYLIW